MSEPPIPDEGPLARLSAALDALADLTRYVRRLNGFMSSEDQQTYRRAQALLVEAGRKI